MSWKLISATLGFLSFVEATSCEAQTPVFGGDAQPRIVEGEALAPRGSFYVGGYSGMSGFQPYTVHFYARRDPADHSPEGAGYTSIPFARRATGRPGPDQKVEWAEGAACPGLYGVMTEFPRLAPPRFHTPRFHSQPPGAGGMGSVPRDMASPPLAVWGYARQADGVPMTMMLTGADGIIQRWVAFAEGALSGCWTSRSSGQ
jgi:hypothetical protein